MSRSTDIDLMHDDVTRPERQYGSFQGVVVVMLKPKMDASSASSGVNSKST